MFVYSVYAIFSEFTIALLYVYMYMYVLAISACICMILCAQ